VAVAPFLEAFVEVYQAFTDGCGVMVFLVEFEQNFL
jgi:hypothetical protein